MKRLGSLLVIICFTVTFCGCATGKGTGALAGGAIGAGAGAAIAKKNRLVGALIGGLIGAAAGAVIGNYVDEQKKNRQQIAREISYHPTQGNVVRIEEGSVNPTDIRPGEELAVKMTYYIICPNPRAKMNVIETIIIQRDNQNVVDPLVRELNKDQGSSTSTVVIPIPEDSAVGEYTVTATISSGQIQDQVISRFNITGS